MTSLAERTHSQNPTPYRAAGIVASGLIDQFVRFLARAEDYVDSHPWLVVMAMHEVFRNLYPSDPYIPFDPNEPHAARINRVIIECDERLRVGSEWPAYPDFAKRVAGTHARHAEEHADRRSNEGETQQLYGSFWDQFDCHVYVEEAVQILNQRFATTGLLDGLGANSTVLDAGCGSGRYTMALARSCPARVIGVDLGAASVGQARRIASDIGISNIEFKVGDVLALPFEDESVDCVFSNGVLHHTGDTERGLRETYRILKPGGRAFLYLYAAGGLFWHARRAARTVIQRIPRDYAADTLRLIAMPANRFIFMDTWYVPIEEHIRRDELESRLVEIGFSGFEKLDSGRPTDLDSSALMSMADYTALWGDGEHRYMLRK